MKHIVSFSGGIGSYLAAKRVADKYGTDDLYLVFTDVMIEDEELYTFLYDAAADVGGKLVIISDGRHPWEVFKDKRFMGNTRTAHCSVELKSKPFEAWLKEQDFDDFTVYLGIDWTESHRLDAHRAKVSHRVEAPLCEPPYITKNDQLFLVGKSGLKLPRLYSYGFSHNNCGGGCVKAGQAQWRLLYMVMPERYQWFENEQEKLMQEVKTARPFLRMTLDGEIAYLTLKEFRTDFLENQESQHFIDEHDFGGCGCFI